MIKPLLAGKAPEDLSELKFPLMASPKLDGIRCLKIDGKALTRKLKPIPNRFAREWIEANLPDGIDGELVLRDWTAPFAEVSSAIMSRDGEPDFEFAAFDLFRWPDHGFAHRYRQIVEYWSRAPEHVRDRLKGVGHQIVSSLDELKERMRVHLAEGYEGTMVRSLTGPYKFGRSTTKEGILLKIKAFEDEEATVIGMVPWKENHNERQTDALGHAKRSHAKAGLVELPKLGALICRFDDGTEFECGTGFTEGQRIDFWELGFELVQGATRAKIKHQPPPGGRKPGEKPRFPVFLGLRHEDDQ